MNITEFLASEVFGFPASLNPPNRILASFITRHSPNGKPARSRTRKSSLMISLHKDTNIRERLKKAYYWLKINRYKLQFSSLRWPHYFSLLFVISFKLEYKMLTFFFCLVSGDTIEDITPIRQLGKFHDRCRNCMVYFIFALYVDLKLAVFARIIHLISLQPTWI